MIPVQTKGSGEPKDSRQRLELLAVLAGLSRMVKPSEITIKGSGYIKTGFQYLSTWQKVAEAAKIHKITIFLI